MRLNSYLWRTVVANVKRAHAQQIMLECKFNFRAGRRAQMRQLSNAMGLLGLHVNRYVRFYMTVMSVLTWPLCKSVLGCRVHPYIGYT